MTAAMLHQALPTTTTGHAVPPYIYHMKRQLVESVIDQQFAKYAETPNAKSSCLSSSGSSEDSNEDFETIIDVEGERECSYIKRVLDEPVREERKKPSWSVADMLREEPPKRQKARRKPQTPLCYRARQDELLRPRDDFQPRVPPTYIPFGMQNFMRDREVYEHQIRHNYHNFQQQELFGKRPNIGSHQFSILGHRKMKVKPQRVIQNSPLDVRNLVAKQTTSKTPQESIVNDVVVLDETPSPIPSPKPKYVPKFFQNLAKANVEKFMDGKTKTLVSEMVSGVNTENTESGTKESSTGITTDDENSPISLVKERCGTSDVPQSTEAIASTSSDKSDHENDSKSTNFGDVLTSFIACILDRGALDLSKATASSSKLIHDKLNNQSYTCSCQPRRRVNPSRSSAKAGVLEPLPTTCSPSPPPAPEARIPEPDIQKATNNQFFLERTRELNFQQFQPQMPLFHPGQLMQSYDNLFKMAAIPNFPMMHQPNFQMNGPFLVPSLPPPSKRARMVQSIF